MTAGPVLATTAADVDGDYRYSLTRTWDPAAAPMRWIMLNPSTADATVNDQTIRRCIAFAHRWGHGGIVVHNLYALRFTDPLALARHADPVGPRNDAVLAAHGPWTLTVCAWGAYGLARGPVVRGLLLADGQALHHLGLTRSQQPRHPLRLRADTPPVRWR